MSANTSKKIELLREELRKPDRECIRLGGESQPLETLAHVVIFLSFQCLSQTEYIFFMQTAEFPFLQAGADIIFFFF